MDNITIVTGLWNIKRDELSEGWSRTFEHYLEKFNQFLDLPYNVFKPLEPLSSPCSSFKNLKSSLI